MPRPSDHTTAPAPVRGARRVSADPQGPVLVEGPVEIVLDDGTVARSDRFMVAICTCRRSRTSPWCDTSHRLREKASDASANGDVAYRAGEEHGPSAEPITEQDRNSR
ncbi:CDGSH iron-sulfur domain-containing protein [Streptomyces sp. NPDC005132]|uniref:CDGSH iron-sulfur domain-containing protein n=1 Tax=Streptomyces sp. NPDC005132 TaxID=3154294 RepID=UPI0033A8794A